jgi:Leucine Rich repeat
LFRVLVRQGSGAKLETWVTGVSFRRGFAHGIAQDIDGVHRLMTAEGEVEPVFGACVSQGWHGLSAKKLAAVVAWSGISCAEMLTFSGATDNDVGALTTSTAARLLKVWFHRCGLSDAAAEFLAAWPCARFVRELNLSGNRIGDRGARALAASPHLSEACALNMEANPLTAHGRHQLVARFGGNVALSPLA